MLASLGEQAALDAADDAVAACSHSGDPALEAEVALTRAELLARMGADPVRAQEDLRVAERLVRQGVDRGFLPVSLAVAAGHVALAGGEASEARRQVRAARALLQDLGLGSTSHLAAAVDELEARL